MITRKISKILFKGLNLIVNYFFELVIKKLKHPPQIISIEDTLLKIISEKCSVSRFGDGELEIMIGNNIVFQDYNEELADKLKKILHIEINRFLVCLPDVFGHLGRKSYWKSNLRRTRKHWYRLLKSDKIYYNSGITRFYLGTKDIPYCIKIIRLLKLIWNQRDVVILEGEKTRLGIGNDLLDNARSIKRILCPATNAYNVYERIIDEAKKLDKKVLILISLGPTATVLSFDLNQLGYQAIDSGHVDIEYEWFLMRADRVIAIPNKFTSEASNVRVIGEMNDDNYEKQIYTRIY